MSPRCGPSDSIHALSYQQQHTHSYARYFQYTHITHTLHLVSSTFNYSQICSVLVVTSVPVPVLAADPVLERARAWLVHASVPALSPSPFPSVAEGSMAVGTVVGTEAGMGAGIAAESPSPRPLSSSAEGVSAGYSKRRLATCTLHPPNSAIPAASSCRPSVVQRAVR